MADRDVGSQVLYVSEMVNETDHSAPEWGRVLIAGGTDWATNGVKNRPTASAMYDMPEAVIIRSINNIKVQTMISGPSANYSIVIDVNGAAYLFGKLPTSGYASGSKGIVSIHEPVKLAASSAGAKQGTRFVGGALSRTHFLLVDEHGAVYGCGNNGTGQLGFQPVWEVETLTRIPGPWAKQGDGKVVQVSVGHTFSLFLSSSGQVYAAGSSEAGQLGNGKTGERLLKGGKTGFDIEVPARLVQGLENKKIVQIASGSQHSLALDEEGFVYGWGFAGYSRLGLGDQKDRLTATLIPQFAGRNEVARAKKILCGPTSSVVIDGLGMFWMAGKWKLTGDGSSGQPWTTFKQMPELGGCKALAASCGGCTQFLTSPSQGGGVMTIAFGQGVLYGELGLGPAVGKSATKPVEVEPLRGLDIIDVAAGAYHTLFLAKATEALTEKSRHPLEIISEQLCLICNESRGEDEDGAIECEKCEQPYHIDCIGLTEVPEGEWFCSVCQAEADAPPEIPLEPFLDALGGSLQPLRRKEVQAFSQTQTSGKRGRTASASAPPSSKKKRS